MAVTAAGRPPKPAAVHERQGTRSRTANRAKSKLVPALPQAPAWLGAEAKTEWARFGELLLANGLVTLLDRAMLAAYVVAWQRFVRAERKIAELADAGALSRKRLETEHRAIIRQSERQGRPATKDETKRLAEIERLLLDPTLDPEVTVAQSGYVALSAWTTERDKAWLQVVRACDRFGANPTMREKAVALEVKELQDAALARFG